MRTTDDRSTLRAAEGRYRRDIAQARTDRLEAFRTGHKAGLSIGRMAGMTGLSPDRVGELLRQAADEAYDMESAPRGALAAAAPSSLLQRAAAQAANTITFTNAETQAVIGCAAYDPATDTLRADASVRSVVDAFVIDRKEPLSTFVDVYDGWSDGDVVAVRNRPGEHVR